MNESRNDDAAVDARKELARALLSGTALLDQMRAEIRDMVGTDPGHIEGLIRSSMEGRLEPFDSRFLSACVAYTLLEIYHHNVDNAIHDG